MGVLAIEYVQIKVNQVTNAARERRKGHVLKWAHTYGNIVVFTPTVLLTSFLVVNSFYTPP